MIGLTKSLVLDYQRRCYHQYLDSVGLPSDYRYIDGNPVRPLVPVQTCQQGLMIIGAYPSARFESRNGALVPIADNLSPFYPEVYFDGSRVRQLPSADELQQHYLDPLELERAQCWITDMVKVFLFKAEHLSNYKKLGYTPSFGVTRRRFFDLAKSGEGFLFEEIALARPQAILALGEEVARVLTNDKSTPNEQLLGGGVSQLSTPHGEWAIVYAPHPYACRRWPKWAKAAGHQVNALREFLTRG